MLGRILGRQPAINPCGIILLGKINMVVVKDLSRLGRNYIMCGQYTEIYFPEKGVRFIAVNDNVDTINNTGREYPSSI